MLLLQLMGCGKKEATSKVGVVFNIAVLTGDPRFLCEVPRVPWL